MHLTQNQCSVFMVPCWLPAVGSLLGFIHLASVVFIKCSGLKQGLYRCPVRADREKGKRLKR